LKIAINQFSEGNSIELAAPSPGITKWGWLFNPLASRENQHTVCNHLILFINPAMNPVYYARFWGVPPVRR
jgi:hypothetical protein